MVIDPTKIHIQSHAVPVWEQQETFQDKMADQVRNAPWLILSIVVHAVVGLILWAVIDPTPPKPEEKAITMQPVEEVEIPEPEEEPEPEPEPEQIEEPILQDAEIVETTEEVTETFEEVSEQTQSAFDSDAWNAAVGLGGGAGGKFGRRGGGRKGLRAGGGKSVAEAIELGLKWLKDHQDEDGKWDADEFMKHDTEGEPCDGAGNPVHDVGLTGLALLAFLGDGSTLRSGPYREQIKMGVNWLREQQQENGLFGENASHDFVYDHAIAAYAMCEAYGLSDYKLLRRYAQKGINYLEYHRNPYGVWRYQPQDGDNDSSVTGWCVMAYKSAQDFGLKVNSQALKMCEAFFDKVTDPLTGKCGYTQKGEPSSRHPGDHATRFPVEKGEALTSVGLLARFFLGQDPKDVQVMTTAADTILKKPPVWNETDGSIDHYYWYYATYALFQMGKPHWPKWEKSLGEAIVKPQRKDGNFKGSWDPIGAWGEDGGRVYSTAILVLTLEAYYRYTRLIR